jgi:cardiolipin synthase A/B
LSIPPTPAAEDARAQRRLRTTRFRVYRFPWRGGNRFRLLRDGPAFYPAMLDAISAARSYILLEMYLVESGAVADRFIEALTAAVQRGVRVYVLLDDFGAMGLTRRDRLRLTTAGIALTFFNPLRYGAFTPNLVRDHRKLLLVDGTVGYTGGMGITDAFDPPAGQERTWRETAVEMRGPVLADWRDLFAEAWARWSGDALSAPACAPEAAGTQLGRVVSARPRAPREIRRSFLRSVRRARHRVWLATAYFVPSWKLRRALRRAARRGADVRVLVPGPITDHPPIRHVGRRFYAGLLRNGVRIFEFQPRFTHTKVLLCDQGVSVGSANLDRWTLRWSLEANQEVDDAGFASEARAMLEADFAQSYEFTYEEWMQRPWHRRLLEWFWGSVDLWIERLHHMRVPRRLRRKR